MGVTTAVNEATPQEHSIEKLYDKRRWYKNPRIIKLNLLILVLLITSTANGFDGSMMNGLQSLPIWEANFNDPTGPKLGLLGAIQNIGGLCTVPIAPYFSDGIGRRKTVAFGAALMVIGAILQTASQSVQMFIGARWLIGFGLGFAGSGAPLLVTEIAYPSQRGILTSIYNSLWPGGAFIAAWVTFATFNQVTTSWAWRIPSAVQGVQPLVQFFFIWLLPESPRWLINKGRNEEARQILGYYHGNGDVNHPLVAYEYEEIVTSLELERKVKESVGWLTLISTPGNRRRMRIIVAIAFFSQWSGNGLVSYYLNKVFITIGITDAGTQLLINAFLQLWGLINAIIGGLLCDKAGRRPLFLLSTAGMLLFFTLQTICSSLYAQHGNKAAGNSVVAFIFLFGMSYSIAYSPLIVTYTVEILPYRLRAKGLSVFGFAITLSLVFNQYINPIALAALGWKYYIVYVAWIAVELVVIFLYLVETKGLTLEETAALFDGADAVKELEDLAAVRAGIEETHDEKSDDKKSEE